MSCEYALIFEIYQAKAPETSQWLMKDLVESAKKILESFRLDLNQNDLNEKGRVLRKFADERGHNYDEVECVLW